MNKEYAIYILRRYTEQGVKEQEFDDALDYLISLVEKFSYDKISLSSKSLRIRSSHAARNPMVSR